MERQGLESVRYYVRGLFRGMPETERLAEQREELETHLSDRIADVMATGVSFDEAFAGAVDSLGNLEELVETMSGQRRNILTRKADALLSAGMLLYGTVYIAAVWIWFALVGFGWRAVFVALPGWLGFAVPFLLAWLRFRSRASESAMVSLERREWVRLSWLGWTGISLVCWLVNVAFLGTGLFLDVVWAWMPMFGLLTWPLSESAYALMLKGLASIRADRP